MASSTIIITVLVYAWFTPGTLRTIRHARFISFTVNGSCLSVMMAAAAVKKMFAVTVQTYTGSGNEGKSIETLYIHISFNFEHYMLYFLGL